MIAYRITNAVNGKVYIGITSKPLDVRWRWHLKDARKSRAVTLLGRAIRKYGAPSFAIEAVACALTWADLCEVERDLIAQHGSRADLGHGYNCTAGGEGASAPSPSQRAALSTKMKLRRATPEFRATLQPRYDSMRGKRQTAEHIKKAAAGRRGRKMPPAAIEKTAAAKRGKPLSAEHRSKLSAAAARRWSSTAEREAYSASRKGVPRDPAAVAKGLVTRMRNRRQATYGGPPDGR